MNKRKRDDVCDSICEKISSSTKMRVHPQNLNKNILNHLKEKLVQKIDKKWSEKFGFIENVVMLPLKDVGKIDSKSGYTEFTVHYTATARKPAANQILFATITNVTKLGVHLQSGPFQLFMHEKMIPSSFAFSDSSFKCQKTGVILKRGVETRVKIVGTSWNDNQYISIVVLQ